MGVSAGMKLSYMAAAQSKYPVKSYLGFYGPSDPTLLGGVVGQLAHIGLYGSDRTPENILRNSPMNMHYYGPALLIHGANDALCVPEHSIRLYAARKSVGAGETMLYVDYEEAHGIINNPDSSSTQIAMDLAEEFVKVTI